MSVGYKYGGATESGTYQMKGVTHEQWVHVRESVVVYCCLSRTSAVIRGFIRGRVLCNKKRVNPAHISDRH